MTTQQIKALSNAVATLDIECGEFILQPESAQEHAINSQIAETLRVKIAAITAMIKAMSTGVDIAPLAPQQLDIQSFLRLVQRRRVTIRTSETDTDRVDIDGVEGDATVISWYDDGAAVELLIRADDAFITNGVLFIVHGVTFIIEEL